MATGAMKESMDGGDEDKVDTEASKVHTPFHP